MWQSPRVWMNSWATKAGDAGHHVQQQRVRGDVEGHAEEHVAGALVHLQGEAVPGGVELEEVVARRQGHVGGTGLGGVPGVHHDPPRAGVRAQQVDGLLQLVHGAVRPPPAAPLHPVDAPHGAIVLRHAEAGEVVAVVGVPELVVGVDRLEVVDVVRPRDEPQQLRQHRLPHQPLGGDRGGSRRPWRSAPACRRGRLSPRRCGQPSPRRGRGCSATGRGRSASGHSSSPGCVFRRAIRSSCGWMADITAAKTT